MAETPLSDRHLPQPARNHNLISGSGKQIWGPKGLG